MKTPLIFIIVFVLFLVTGSAIICSVPRKAQVKVTPPIPTVMCSASGMGDYNIVKNLNYIVTDIKLHKMPLDLVPLQYVITM